MKKIFIFLLLISLGVFNAYSDPAATRIRAVVANFDNNLSSADDTVQKALETLDEVAGTGVTQEQLDDGVGVLVNDADGVRTLITVTYDDSDNAIDFVVDNDLDNYDNTNSGFITNTLTQEEVEDYIGAMTSGNTETRCTVTYQDSDGTIDFVVDDLDTNLTQEEVDDFVNALIKDADSTHTRITITYDDTDNAFDFVVDDMNDDVPESGDFGAAAALDADGSITDDYIDSPDYAADSIDDEHLNFGTGAGQIEAEDIPVSEIATATYNQSQEMFNVLASSGRISGGNVTANGGDATKIDVAAGTGWIKATDSDVAEILAFDWSASTGVHDMPIDTVRYIGIEYNAGSPQVVVKTAEDWDWDTDFPLAKVVNQGDTLHILNNPWWTGDIKGNTLERFQSMGHLKRDEHVGGLILTQTGTRNVSVTAGTLWSRLNEFAISALDTSSSGTFELYKYNGVAGTWSDSDVSQYPVTSYNDMTSADVVALTNNRYANMWVYVEADDDEVAMVYGQAQYVSSSGAEAEAPPTTLPLHVGETGLLIGRIIIKEGVDAPVQVDTVWATVFTASQASDHGNLTGLADDDHSAYENELDDESGLYAALSDVTNFLQTGDAVDDDDVAFDDADSNWTATKIGPAIEEMDDVINGGVPNAATGKVDWSQLTNVPAGFADGTDASGGGGTPNILDLGDDAGDDSTDLIEIATTGDTNSIFTESSADKLLIAVGNNWPTADAAVAAASQVITDNAIATVDDADAADNDFAKFTAAGLEGRSYAEVAADLSLEIGTDVQAYDADLTTYAGITPSADVQSVLSAADEAAIRTFLDLEAGTDFYSVSAADIAFEVQLDDEAGLYAVLSNVSDFVQADEANSVDSAMYVDGSIDVEHLADDIVTHAEMADSDQTDTKCFYFEDPTAADDFNSVWANKTANDFLITEIWAESDQTVTFMLQVDDGSPADVDSVDLAPAAGEAEDTSLDGDTTVAAGEELDLAVTSVASTPTWCSICFTGNWVD